MTELNLEDFRAKNDERMIFSDAEVLNYTDFDIENDFVLLLAKKDKKSFFEKFSNCFIYEKHKQKDVIIVLVDLTDESKDL
jgi:hypothetical protein